MERSGNERELSQLLQAILDGNQSQFKALETVVSRYVKSRASGSDVAELVTDILGTVYSNVREGKFRGKSVASFYAYVFAVSSNTLKYQWRKAKRITYLEDTPENPRRI